MGKHSKCRYWKVIDEAMKHQFYCSFYKKNLDSDVLEKDTIPKWCGIDELSASEKEIGGFLDEYFGIKNGRRNNRRKS